MEETIVGWVTMSLNRSSLVVRVRLQTAQLWSIKNDLIWEVENCGLVRDTENLMMVPVLVQTYSFSDLGLG